MKVRMLGVCDTVQVYFSKYASIILTNDLQTCGKSDWTVNILKTKAIAHSLKNITDRKQTVSHHKKISNKVNSLNHVMPNTVIGIRTRSPLMGYQAFNMSVSTKRTGYFACHYSTSCLGRSGELVAEKLVELSTNSKKNNIQEVNNIIKALLNNPDFWMHCYESIKGNPESTSISKYAKENFEGQNSDFFFKLAYKISSGIFQFNPTKQIILKKPGKNHGSLELVTLRDKIVQKGLATILEVLSEHRFYDSSFAFREGRSARDAIKYIRCKVPSGKWAIRGDIAGCFDNFDHKRLVSLVKNKYTNNQVFIDLLYKALKTKIIKLNSSYLNKIGTPRDSVVSPILCNIYLHELDRFIFTSPYLEKYRLGKKANTINKAFKKLLKVSESELELANSVKIEKGKFKYWKFLHKLRITKLKKARDLGMHRINYKSEHVKLAYVRYADDFILFVWGRNMDCVDIKKKISDFLKGELALTLSDKKISINNLKKNSVKFLGFDLWQGNPFYLSNMRNLNPIGNIDRVNMESQFRGSIVPRTHLKVTFDFKSKLRELIDKGFARYKNNSIIPCSYKPALQYNNANIVKYLSTVFRGLANYYKIADNWWHAKSLYNYYGLYSTSMTLAHKSKSKISKIFKKYGKNLNITRDGEIIASFDSLTNSTFKYANLSKDAEISSDITQLLLRNLKLTKLSPVKNSCAICCDPVSEMLHFDNVGKDLTKKVPNSFNYYLKAMKLANRKVLPVCKYHHNIIHAGKHDNISLTLIRMFKYFELNDYEFNQKKADALIKKASLRSDKN